MTAVFELVVVPLVVLAALVVLGVVTSVSVGLLLVGSLAVLVASVIGLTRAARHVEAQAARGRRARAAGHRLTYRRGDASPLRPRHP